MRLPNGFGNVSKLAGNRRKPYRARITVGWTTDSMGKQHQKYQTIGYYSTREEGIVALSNYHQNNNPASDDITFSRVYSLWSKEHYSKISKSNRTGYVSSFKYCTALHDMSFRDIRLTHLQKIIDTSSKNFPVLRRIKILYSQLYRYAMQNDICEKDYSRFVDIAQYKDRNPNGFKRCPFSEEEISQLWNISSSCKSATIVLMMIYSGCRIGELLNLKKENIWLEQRYFFIEHAKTSSGVRYVPIAENVYPFWKAWYESCSSPFLFSGRTSDCISYSNFYQSYWTPLMDKLGMKHLPHDTRHTCITLLTLAGINDKIIRKIVGHKGQNITESVYTHFEISELLEAINQIE